MRPVIAVTPLWDDERQSIWMLPGYMDGITQAGGVPIILPLNSSLKDLFHILSMCNGLLLTGGHDCAPRMYGEEKREACGDECAARDKIEPFLFGQAVKDGKPVLGICRGIQLMNAVMYGGTLYQDLPTEFDSPVNHHMQPPYDRVCHYVNIVKGSPLYKVLQTERIGVNSYHHQAIKNVAKDLTVMATSEDGLAEAVYLKDKPFVWGLQWHPEFSYKSDVNSQKIFSAFVNACKNSR
ncbi:MAG: gamma-glutamyl-gamma-aminobutyrate hydrolase family protein [Clostridia bacterium]|nr:gamma-glutamyl-gamma-aminobutyrate hydrolase family protein [Clostridia bacterium]